ncbi:MAG: hypothetical protein ACRDHN_06365, partial [Thermomicrobiales bacterium]
GDLSELRFANLELALGQGELPITLSGEAKLAPRANGSLDVTLASKRVDLDLGDQKAAATGAAHVLPLLTEAQRLLAALPFPARIAVTADGILAGGQLARDIHATLRAANGLVQVQRLEAKLPGRAAISLTGKTDRDRFSGPLTFESEEPQIFSRWLLGEEMSRRFSLSQTLRVTGELSFAPNEMSLRSAEAELGRMTLKGAVALQQARDPVKQILDLRLVAEKVDIDPLLPFLQGVLNGQSGIDFVAEFSAVDARLFGAGMKTANLSASSVGGVATITQLSIDNLDGFSLLAKRMQAEKGEIEFSLTATRAGGASKALEYLSGSAELAAILARYSA